MFPALGLAYQAHGSWELPEGQQFFLAWNCVVAWLGILVTLSAFQWSGKGTVPIIWSLGELKTMCAVAVLIFGGFAHGFLALLKGAEFDPLPVFLQLAVLGDAEPFRDLDMLENKSLGQFLTGCLFLLVVALGFTIGVLNLFIAVQGDAYDHAREIGDSIFLKERAGTCRDVLLLPRLPFKVPAPRLCSFMVNICGSTMFVVLLFFNERAEITAALLLLTILLGRALLMPEHGEALDNKYLWICSKVTSYNSDELLRCLQREELSQSGRMQSMKQHVDLHFEAVNERLHRIEACFTNRLERLEMLASGIEPFEQTMSSNSKSPSGSQTPNTPNRSGRSVPQGPGSQKKFFPLSQRNYRRGSTIGATSSVGIISAQVGRPRMLLDDSSPYHSGEGVAEHVIVEDSLPSRQLSKITPLSKEDVMPDLATPSTDDIAWTNHEDLKVIDENEIMKKAQSPTTIFERSIRTLEPTSPTTPSFASGFPSPMHAEEGHPQGEMIQHLSDVLRRGTHSGPAAQCEFNPPPRSTGPSNGLGMAPAFHLPPSPASESPVCESGLLGLMQNPAPPSKQPAGLSFDSPVNFNGSTESSSIKEWSDVNDTPMYKVQPWIQP